MKQFDFEFCVAASHPSIEGHFPGNPVVPGVLLLDHVMANFAALSGRGWVRIERVKFTSALKPGESALAQCVLDDERASFRVDVAREGGHVLVAEGLGVVAREGRT